MHFLLLAVVKWASILQLFVEDPAEDQWSKEVSWQSFNSKPFVLVIGDRDAADRATMIGKALHSAYNKQHIAPERHLHTTTPDEKIKVIAVAALPDVPGIFKGLFRGGFKDEGKTGVILDWDRRLSSACGYREGTVLIAYKSPKSELLQTQEVVNADGALLFVASCVRKLDQ